MKLIRPQSVSAATYTRASDATYYDADGVLQTASSDVLRISYEPPDNAPLVLVEAAATNLILYSEDETNAAWDKTELGGVTANDLAAPDGATTADLIYEKASAAGVPEQHYDVQQITVAGLDNSLTYSRFVVPAGRDYVNLAAISATNGDNGFNATFSLTGDGSLVFGEGRGDGTYTGATIQKLVDGSYRCSIAGVPSAGDAGTTVNCLTRIASGTDRARSWSALTNKTFTRASTGYGLTADDVLAPFASGDPRITDRGLLIEGASTNLQAYSQDFTNRTKTGITVVADDAVAPDGTMTADKLVCSAGTGVNRVYRSTASLAGQKKARSLFIKPAPASGATVLYLASDTGADVYIDLTTGHVLSGSASVAVLASGWWKIDYPWSPVVDDASDNHFIYLTNRLSNSPSPAFTGAEYVHVWGEQIEVGAAATSYIPTTTATATRQADAARLDSLAITAPFTLYMEADLAASAGVVDTFATLSVAGDANNRIRLSRNAAGNAEASIKSAGSTTATLQSGAIGGGSVQIAISHDGTNLRLSVNGAAATTVADPPVGALSRINLGATESNTLQLGGYIRRLAVLAEAKTATELGDMTGEPGYTASGDEVVLFDAGGDGINYVGDGSSGLHVWGAQGEAGSAPTSYIPTTSATESRAADVLGGAGLIYSNVAEDDYPDYDAGSTYDAADRVISGHHIYESAVGSNVGNPVTDTDFWIDLGATNRWKMFDESVGSQTINADDVTIAFKTTGRADSVALLSLSATQARITITDTDNALIHDSTHSLTSTTGIDNWWSYFFEPYELLTDLVVTDLPPVANSTFLISLTRATGDVECGACILGLQKTFGTTALGARVGIQDYSVKTTDEFGNFTILERAYSKRANFTVLVDNAAVDGLVRLLAAYRATPAVYIGSETYSSAILYGFYRDFTMEISYPNQSLCTIELEGLA